MANRSRQLRNVAILLALVALGTCALRVAPVPGLHLPNLGLGALPSSITEALEDALPLENRLVVLPSQPPSCFGSILALDEDDGAVPDAVVTWYDVNLASFEPTIGFTATTDADGLTPPAMRPCGNVWVNVLAGGRTYAARTLEIVGTDDALLRLPAFREAEVCVVDETDRPVEDVEVFVIGTGERAVRLAEAGCWGIAAPGWQTRLVVSSPERGIAHAAVPLDDLTHIVRLSGFRDVVVHAECDPGGCPTPLSTGYGGCTGGTSPFICSCPAGGCFITGPPDADGSMTVLGEAPPGVSSITLDLRTPTAGLHGRWTGPLPASVTLDTGPSPASVEVGLGESLGSTSFYVGKNGEFSLSDQAAGAYVLRVDSDSKECGSRPVVLLAGQDLDVGTLSPDRGSLSGKIDADFPLDEASLTATVGSTRLLASGSFEVSGAPDSGSLLLTLVAPDRGRWSASFPLGGPVEWTVSWHDGQNVDPVDVGDTGP